MTKHALFVHDNRSLGGVGHVSQQLAAGLEQRGWGVDHLNLARPGDTFSLLTRLDRMRGVIVATQNFSTAYVTRGLAAIARRPWVMCVHGPVTDVVAAARPNAIKRALLRSTYRSAPVIACSSQASLDALRAFCAIDTERQRVRVIRNTAAPAFFLQGANAPRLTGRDIGFVGRLSAEKRPALLVDTLKLLPGEFRLRLVGMGPLAQELAQHGAAELQAGRLRFEGQQKVDPATYRQWDVTLLASSYEGYPLVLLESLASGVPVVSTPIAPAVEMLGAHAPYMVAREATPQALAQAVQGVLALDRDKVARDIAAINAAHDPQAFIAEWDALLSESVAA